MPPLPAAIVMQLAAKKERKSFPFALMVFPLSRLELKKAPTPYKAWSMPDFSEIGRFRKMMYFDMIQLSTKLYCLGPA